MQITSVRTRQVDILLPEPFYPAWAPGRVETQLRVVYVRIDTDAGLYGIAGHQLFGAEEQCVARIATHLIGTYHRALGTAKALADYGVFWLEEPLPRQAYAELQRLHRASPIPIAGGNSGEIRVPQGPGLGVELQDWIFGS